jgi:hypothetical protein
MSTIFVCGGRNFTDHMQLYAALDDLHACHHFTRLIDGGSRGADAMAHNWAVSRKVPCKMYPALWNVHGRSAGPIRNQQMLDEGKPDLVVAFAGGNGTADMVRRAKAAGIKVLEIPARSLSNPQPPKDKAP